MLTNCFASLLCRAYLTLKAERDDARARHRETERHGRCGPISFHYPEHLANPFPPFSTWLYLHIRTQRNENQFPIPQELLWISCPPSDQALAYRHMWAYGCHYRCDDESGPTHVTYDSGVASLSSSNSNTVMDVGVLKSILLVTYGGANFCVMKCSWIAPTDEGRRTIRKDNSGFWTVKFDARQDSRRHNPYVFPSAVSQVNYGIVIDDRFRDLPTLAQHHGNDSIQ